jgi:hypothetical protein
MLKKCFKLLNIVFNVFKLINLFMNFLQINMISSVADLDPFDTDPDPAFHFDTDPDPALQFDPDPDQ